MTEHAVNSSRIFLYTSRAFERLFRLRAFVGAELQRARKGMPRKDLVGVLAWGRKPSAKRSRHWASALHLPLVQLEDGFLRSWGTGEHFPPLALVFDEAGIYYDCTRPSELENLLNSDADLLAGLEAEVEAARKAILVHGLSKYNYAPMLQRDMLREHDKARVLVVDQTAGDLSVSLGGATAATFTAMLEAARVENPDATIYVKTHPEVASGRKGGYLNHVREDARTVVLREPVNPMSLIAQMDKVYVVSSTMGFEALLAGKPVICFGLPWYAGWGVTDDRQSCQRRTRKRSVDELFAAAYFHYARYLDPVTHARGDIFDVIDWLLRQREHAQRFLPANGRMVCVGFRRWKAANVKPLLSLDQSRVVFVPDASAAVQLGLTPDDRLVYWGGLPPQELMELAREQGCATLRMEDGFVRSVGLGSDLIRPMSLVLDGQGMYFDATRPSDLEVMLNTTVFAEEELEEARRVREFIVEHGITKYNIEPREKAAWNTEGRAVILVPGQVEDDASIRLGCTDVKTNLELLRRVRVARPDAFIVYKPHPDVMSGNRAGRVGLDAARQYADHVETRLSVVSCIEACNEVHTMTSLTGFDALLRGKSVVTYGQPFYAGWGLTEDRDNEGEAFLRRQRRLTLDELVAGVLLRYPIYWDFDLKGYTSCQAVLHRIVEMRDALEASGKLHRLKVGYIRRQCRKLRILAVNYFKR